MRHDRNGLVTVAKAEKSFRKVVCSGRRTTMTGRLHAAVPVVFVSIV